MFNSLLASVTYEVSIRFLRFPRWYSPEEGKSMFLRNVGVYMQVHRHSTWQNPKQNYAVELQKCSLFSLLKLTYLARFRTWDLTLDIQLTFRPLFPYFLINNTSSWKQHHERRNITVKFKLSGVMYGLKCCQRSRGRVRSWGQIQPAIRPAGNVTVIGRAISLMITLRAVQQPRLIVQGYKQHFFFPLSSGTPAS